MSDNIFDNEESRILLKTQKTREHLLDGYIVNGVENLDAEDIDVVTKLLDSLDKQIHTNTRIKMARKETETNNNVMELVKRVILQSGNKREGDVSLVGFKDIKTIPDELDNERVDLDINDFIRKEDD